MTLNLLIIARSSSYCSYASTFFLSSEFSLMTWFLVSSSSAICYFYLRISDSFSLIASSLALSVWVFPLGALTLWVRVFYVVASRSLSSTRAFVLVWMTLLWSASEFFKFAISWSRFLSSLDKFALRSWWISFNRYNSFWWFDVRLVSRFIHSCLRKSFSSFSFCFSFISLDISSSVSKGSWPYSFRKDIKSSLKQTRWCCSSSLLSSSFLVCMKCKSKESCSIETQIHS